MSDQMDLFSYVESIDRDPVTNTTCVVIDGKCKNVTWEELFDEEKYDQLSCVTYVTSAGFLNKAVGNFRKLKLIIGIEKPDVKKAIAESMSIRMNKEGAKFFEELPDDGKQRLIDREWEIRFSKTQYVIHSKFYLLSNSKTGDTRVIFGSANLTNTAFNNAIKQYEDIMVFDNNPLFDTYAKRFDCIYSATEDYVPQDVITKYKEGKFISLANFTPEERTEDLIKTLERENIIPVCNETILDYIQEAQAENEKEVTQTKATYEVITTVGKKRKGDKSGNFTLKTAQELEAAKGKIIDILFRHTKSESNLQRFSMTFNDSDKKQYVIYPKNAENEEIRPPEVFDRQATNEEIKCSIENLLQFINAYKKFVAESETDDENLSRIFEILLYAFISAYIFKLRQENSDSKADIPIMLVIAGRASSGKSNLLAYIDRILSGRQLLKEQHYIQYKQIDKDFGDLFRTDNTYPLLVDEVAQKFFNSSAASKGEELIKYLSNTLDSKHPVMICTTNTGAFSIPPQVARRIYFLKVDTCFDERKKLEANEYYSEVMANANNILFRDFCSRMSEKILANESLYGANKFDYLHVAREIFKEYFAIANIKVPAYFPNEIYKDYDSRGRNMWRTLFVQARDRFTYSPKKGDKEATLTVALKDLTNGVKDTQVYMNYLKQEILVEEAGLYVVLRSDAFCDWIHVKRVTKLNNLWAKSKL